MVEVTLTYGGNIREFEKALDSNDENFDINDSIYYLLDYGTEEEVHNHNGIRIKFITKEEK